MLSRTFVLLLALTFPLFSLGILGCEHTLTVNIHFPDAMLCSNCYLLVGTGIDWSIFSPDGPPAIPVPSSILAARIAPNRYQFTQEYNDTLIGQTVNIAIHYNAWLRNVTDGYFLNSQCRLVLDNYDAKSLGALGSATLLNGSTTVTMFPFFCGTRGKLQSEWIWSEELALTKELFTYVSPSVLQNQPLFDPDRRVMFLIMQDAFALEHFTVAFDMLTTTGLIMQDIIVLGLGQGTTFDPWIDGGTERTKEMTPTEQTCPSVDPDTGYGIDMVRWQAESIIPMLAQRYGVAAPDRTQIGIFGYSFGGLLSCYSAFLVPELLSYAYCGSPSLYWNCNQFTSIVENSTADFNQYPVYLAIDMGDREDYTHLVGPNLEQIPLIFTNPYFKEGVNVFFHFHQNVGDSHQWGSWYQHFYSSIIAILGINNPENPLPFPA